MSSKTFSCPACGEEVPLKARSCPHCGACEKSGWNEEASGADGLDLPEQEEEFDYEKFKEEEFGTPRKLRGKELFWKIVAGILLVAAIVGYVVSFTFHLYFE
jgi:zinc-ribbon domain